MTHFKMVQKYQTPLNLCRNNTKPESKRVQFNRFRICVKLFTLKILCHKSKHPWISGNGKAKCRCIYCIRYGTCGCASQNITSEVLQAENESKSVSWEVPRSQMRSEHSNPRGDFWAGREGLIQGSICFELTLARRDRILHLGKMGIHEDQENVWDL